MMPERAAIVFDNAKIDGESYLNYTILIDDILTISIVMDILNTAQFNKGELIDPKLSVAFADSLDDRYVIPEYYESIDYFIIDKKRVI